MEGREKRSSGCRTSLAEGEEEGEEKEKDDLEEEEERGVEFR